ncbi:MAG: TolC family protein, partial [Candidatus Kapaibacterium sp.]
LERKSVADVRESAGLAARTDVLQARMDVNDVQAQLMDLRTKRRKDELALQTVMGMDTTGSIRCADDIRVDTSLDVQRLRRRLLGANERVLQSMIDLRIARLQKREAAAAGLPGLDLQAGYMFNRSRNSAGFALFNENNGFSAGANLVVPLFNGLRTDAELEQRQLEILKKEHSVQNMLRSVSSEFESMAEEYRCACSLLPLVRESADLARQNSDIAMERFRVRDITGVELRMVQTESLQRSQELVQTTLRAKSAELRLKLMAGELGDEEE